MDVRNLAAQHDALAERIKLYEQHTRELPPLEVLNELRYALRAAVEFISQRDVSTPDTEREQELIARMDHALKCAYHDLIDGLVIELVGLIDNLIHEFPTATYEVAGGRVTDIRHDIREVERVISESRGQPQRRAEIYDKDLYDGWFQKLLEHHRYIVETATPDIGLRHEGRQEQRDHDDRRLRRRQWLMLIPAAIAGLLLKVIWDLL